MSDTRHGTLSDYLRVLRRSRWVIVALTLLCAGIAAGQSLSQKPKYLATAQVSFQEQNSSNAAVGLTAVQTLTPAQLAAEGASTMLSNAVLAPVRQKLRTSLTVAQLRTLLATSVDPSSALVILQASGSGPQFAAALANDVADSAVAIQTTTERRRFATTARSVERQYQTLGAQINQGGRNQLALSSLLDRFTTLQTLSLNATPASVATRASVPSSPASPKPVRSIVFGTLIGLLLSIALAFVRDSLDRRLRDLTEIEETLEMRVVGSVREGALGNAAYVPNGRGPMTEQDVESFRVLRTNISFLDVDRPVKSILVTSPLPAEGKSTVAASLAATNAAAGKRTVLLECDLRRPCFSDRLPVARSPGLTDYLAGEAGAADVVQAVALSGAGTTSNQRNGGRASAAAAPVNLAVISAGTHSSRPAELLGSQRFKEFLEELAATYDILVIDTPPMLSVSDTLEIISLADSVLLCIRVDQTTRDQARAVKQALARLPHRTTAVVVTGLKPGHESEAGYYTYAYTST